MPKNNRTVSQRDDGQWANKKDGSQRGSSLHNTQKRAADAARDALKRTGGGELKIKDEGGRIRAKDTIPQRKTRGDRRANPANSGLCIRSAGTTAE